ncbi:formate dehydrogenase (NAD+) [Ceratobasidium sp. 428]|nr:formate dehydrogenase (NAD+) [Ceratobasidium sp. 395]KAG8788012.1 formate dehydrogenase (NAD+) [Ceratobasidium sp. 428]
MIERGDWQVSQIARNAYDLEGKVVGTIGAGRIGYRVPQRLVPFNCKELLYFDYNPLPDEAAKVVRARRVDDIKDFISQCDIVTVSAPLHEGTRGLTNANMLKHCKRGGNGMVPHHYSGTTLDARLRYAQGAKSILENYFDGKPQDPANLIVENGSYATKNYE